MNTIHLRRVRVALAACVLSALVAGCGGDDASSGTPASAAKANAAPAGAGGA
ncbi:TPA: hypothetical protein QDC07_008199, partial [Burkholderia stabilis]|nr:hypothetical protein [Burkholderia stabilis]